MHAVTLTDGTVTLRPWSLEDAADVHRMVQDPEIPRFTAIPHGHSLDRVKGWLSSRDTSWTEEQDYSWAIVGAEDGMLLGSVGIEPSRDDEGIGDLGYWVAAEARGRGVARRAVALATQWGLQAAGLARLQITTHEENLASQRVAEVNGYRREGVLRAWREQHEGRRVDLVMFSRLPDDGAPAR